MRACSISLGLEIGCFPRTFRSTAHRHDMDMELTFQIGGCGRPRCNPWAACLLSPSIPKASRDVFLPRTIHNARANVTIHWLAAAGEDRISGSQQSGAKGQREFGLLPFLATFANRGHQRDSEKRFQDFVTKPMEKGPYVGTSTTGSRDCTVTLWFLKRRRLALGRILASVCLLCVTLRISQSAQAGHAVKTVS